jgi:hypothetical protein
MKFVAVCFWLLSLFGMPSAHGADVEKYPIGAVYKSFVSVFHEDSGKVLYDIALPSGDWYLAAQLPSRNELGLVLSRQFFLVRLNLKKADAYVSLNVLTQENRNQPWPSDVNCKSAALYRSADENDATRQKCWRIDARSVWAQTNQPLGQQASQYLRDQKISSVPHALAMSYVRLGEHGKYLALEYGVLLDAAQQSNLQTEAGQQAMVAQFRPHVQSYTELLEKSYKKERFRNSLEAFALDAAVPAAPLTSRIRKALVIGNNNYQHVPKLYNAVADAQALAQALAQYGYAVSLKTDVSEKEMKAALRTFKNQINAGDEVAIFFAGHGVQLNSANYLLPTDVVRDNPEQVKDEAVALQKILDDMAEKRAKFTLAVLDACRDNPFQQTLGRSFGDEARGVAPTSLATGQMIVFSAGAGQQALDRLGPNDTHRNSLFTRVFLQEMKKPGVSIDKLVRNVRTEVFRLAQSVGHPQVPAIYDQVVGEFFFSK